MLRSLTAKQFYEWVAYNELEPFGEWRDDYRAASIAQMIYNVAVEKQYRKNDIGQFVLKFGEQTRRQTPEQQKALFMLMVGAHKPLPPGERAIDVDG